MKKIIQILSGVLLVTCVVRAEPAKIGNEADYILTVIRACKTQIGITTGSNDISTNILLSGGYTCVPNRDADNFELESFEFSSDLRKVIEANGWDVISYQSKSTGFLPRRIYVLARRNGVFLDIFVCIFPLEGGGLGIAYTQGTK
jgi:phosphomevalonate kinase